MPVRSAVYLINIDGQDITSDLTAILISLELTFNDGDELDTMTLEIDDTNGIVALPRVGAPVTAAIYWSDSGEGVEFSGTTDETGSSSDSSNRSHRSHHKGGGKSGSLGNLSSSGSRSSGRIITISAKSADLTGKLKNQRTKHLDNMSFGDAAQQFGSDAGLQVTVGGDLSSKMRDYWAMDGENFMHWGVRMARELGASFLINGSNATFAPRSGGQGADGSDLEGVEVTWGDNLISWSISPNVARPVHGTFQAPWYDKQNAEHKKETGSSSSSGGEGDGSTAPDPFSGSGSSGSGNNSTGLLGHN